MLVENSASSLPSSLCCSPAYNDRKQELSYEPLCLTHAYIGFNWRTESPTATKFTGRSGTLWYWMLEHGPVTTREYIVTLDI